jgi:polyhydroxyalkanoate synthase
LPPIDESIGRDSFRAVDPMREAFTAQWTAGFSPASFTLALFGWSIHLASAPGKSMELLDKAVRKACRLLAHSVAATGNPLHRLASNLCRATSGFALKNGANKPTVS